MYDTSAYWQAQLMNWGPKVLIAVLILIATWIVARAVKWVLQKAIDRTPALRKHMTGSPDETVGHQLGTIAKLIIWLVGIMAALPFPGGRIPLRSTSSSQRFAFLPRLADLAVRWHCPCRHRRRRPDSAHRGQRRRPARPRWHRLDRRNNAHAAGSSPGAAPGATRPASRGPRECCSTHSS